MCKLDLKDAYFWVPLSKDYSNMIQFPWSGNLYKFLCLCFVLVPAPRMFLKTFESSYINIVDTEHKDNDLPRRLASFKDDSRRDFNGQGPSNHPVRASGLCSIFFKTNSRFNHIVTGPRVVKKNTLVMLKNYPLDSALHNCRHK